MADEMQEVINYRPHWIVRKGNLLFFLIFIFLFVLSWFVKYPDILYGTARFRTLNSSHQTQFFAEIMISKKDFQKIRSNQKATMKINNSKRYSDSYLTGTINCISNMPGKNDSFLIKINLSNNLDIKYEKNIFSQNDFKGNVEIIINKRLFDRIVDGLSTKR